MLQSKQVKLITYTGVFAALIFLTTWMFHVPVGSHGGYIHFGDSLIYMAAAFLPMPYAMAAGAIGAGLSDLLSPGGAIWLLPTVIIKPLCCLAFTNKREHLLNKRNIGGVFFGGLVNIVGYTIATIPIAGLAVAIADIPLSVVQPAGSAICFVIWAFALDKIQLKQRSTIS